MFVFGRFCFSLYEYNNKDSHYISVKKDEHAYKYRENQYSYLNQKSAQEIAFEQENKERVESAKETKKRQAQQELAKRGISSFNYDAKLISAAKKGDVELIRLLISAGVDVKGEKGKAALVEAKKNGNADVISLLTVVTSTERQNPQGLTIDYIITRDDDSLFRAVMSSEHEPVAKLIANGANVNVKDEYSGCTLLMEAVRSRNMKVAELLLHGGADVNAKDYNGKTALIHAVERGHVDMVNLLLQSGARVEITDGNRQTALDIAKKEGRSQIEELLQKHIEEVRKREEAQEQLTRRGIDASAYNSKLISAAKFGDVELVKLLLSVGADVNTRDYNGTTALDWAKKKGHANVVEILAPLVKEVQNPEERKTGASPATQGKKRRIRIPVVSDAPATEEKKSETTSH